MMSWLWMKLLIITCQLCLCDKYISKEDYFVKYSTKTPYKVFEPTNGHLPPKVELDGCTPANAWGLIRHGTRYPSEDGIVKMGNPLTRLKKRFKSELGNLSTKHLEALVKWKNPAETKQAKLLHVEGEKELERIGERLQNRFPELFNNYSPDHFTFRSTSKQRAKESGKFFARGIFGRPVEWERSIIPHDPILRFYKLCSKWIKKVKKNPEALAEKRKFETSSIMNEVRKQVSAYLGLESQISMDELELLYLACNFDFAWRKDRLKGPWCEIFSEAQLEVLEYREDLEYYWIDGPGYSVNSDAACVLMQDLFEKINDDKKGVFYFTHSGAVLKFLAFLNIFADKEALRSDNFATMKHSRQWRTSTIGPFAANVVFVIISCGSQGDQITDDNLQVQLYINEALIDIDGCGKFGSPCTLSEFKKLYDKPCDFDEICTDSSLSIDDSDVSDDKY